MHAESVSGRRRSDGSSVNNAGKRSNRRDSNMIKEGMYHYTECGLNNVWLLDGFTVQKTPYGKAIAIDHADGLHRAIALRLVNNKPRWSGGEFRFVRKELDMSQAALALILGKDAQSVARWEKSGRVPKMADRLLRVIYQEHAGGNQKVIELVKRLNELDQQHHERMLFEVEGKNWRLRA